MQISKSQKPRMLRRTNGEIQRNLLENLAVAVREIGFQKLTLRDVCKYANVRPNIVYNRYGSLSGLLEAFCMDQHDYWVDSVSGVNLELLLKNPKEYYFRMVDSLIAALYDRDGWFRASLIWEITDDHPITRTLSEKREAVMTDLTYYLNNVFASNNKADPTAITSVLIAGIYYLIMRREGSTFNGIDFSTDDGRRRLTEAVYALVNFFFQAHEYSSILKKLIDEGVDEGIICRSYGITQEQLEFFKQRSNIDRN